MDPMDGTSAFLQGGQYAVSLALLEDGKEVLGVLGCPNLMPGVGGRVQERVCDRDGMGVMLAAVKGQGASWRPMGRGGLLPATRIDRGRGNAPVELRDVHFVDSSNSPATLTGKVRELAEITGALYPAPTELYSSHMRYAAMALGGREFVQLRWPKPGKGPWSIWDHAGSQLIYAESGAGKVTDLAGNPINFTTGEKLSKSWGLITADETIHGKILALVTGMLAADASPHAYKGHSASGH
jgi:3'(2'), 5'-bisphosphate nucleotidase